MEEDGKGKNMKIKGTGMSYVLVSSTTQGLEAQCIANMQQNEKDQKSVERRRSKDKEAVESNENALCTILPTMNGNTVYGTYVLI